MRQLAVVVSRLVASETAVGDAYTACLHELNTHRIKVVIDRETGCV